MSRKKHTGQSAQPLPDGEFYGPYDVPKEAPLQWIKCLDCFRWLGTQDALQRHWDTNCEVRDYKTGQRIYATDRQIQ